MAGKWLDYYDLDELLSDEEKMTRNVVREFVDNEIRPHIADAFHEEKPLDLREFAPRMAKLGIIGAFIPREYGAAGANHVTYGLICQEVGRVDSSLRKAWECLRSWTIQSKRPGPLGCWAMPRVGWETMRRPGDTSGEPWRRGCRCGRPPLRCSHWSG